VLTDQNGNFALTGDYLCTAGSQIYVLAVGGNPGLSQGQTNANLSMMAALGRCPGSGTFASTVPYILIDEVTTAASAYALAGFMPDMIHLASSGTILATTDMANAFAGFGNLANIATGSALAATPNGNGIVPQAELNTVANILSSCVNSVGSSSSACTTLFSNALNNGTQPTDTLTAALNLVRSPAANIAPLFSLQTTSSPFVPNLSMQPVDFSLAIIYKANLSSPRGIAADGSGNVWIADMANNDIVELSATGVPAAGSPFSTVNMNAPVAVAVDLNGNVWAPNSTVAAGLTKISGTMATTYAPSGLTLAQSVSADVLGNIFVPNQVSPYTLSKIISTGAMASGYPVSTGASNPSGIALDASGDAWVSNGSGTGFIEVSSMGTASTADSGASNIYASVFDSSGDLWAVNPVNNSVIAYDINTSASLTGSPFTGAGIQNPAALALDGAGNVWVANGAASGGISELSSTGTVLSTSAFTPEIEPLQSAGIAVDGSGNVWVSNSTGDIAEFMGIAAPVNTPVAALYAPGCGTSAQLSATPTTASQPQLAFMLNSQLYLAGIQSINTTLASHFLNNPQAELFTTGNKVNPLPTGWCAQGGMKFSTYLGSTGYTAFDTAQANGLINAHVNTVIYDNEEYSNSGETPSTEQTQPAYYTTQFATLAHTEGYHFIATPSRDLVTDQTDFTGGTDDSYYLANATPYNSPGPNRPFPTWAATAASQAGDIFEIQAQAHTIDGQYVSFATMAASEAVQANGSVKVLIGLSTNYGTAQDWYNAVMSTYQLPNVIGYWINTPSENQTAYKEVIAFFQLLQRLLTDAATNRVQRRLPVQHASYIFTDSRSYAVLSLVGQCCDMWRQNHIR